MAGSYGHAVDEEGRLVAPRDIGIAAENLGDAYETIEHMYGMIWWLAGGDRARVGEAWINWEQGIEMSPGRVENDDE